mmetsp:Transcript_20014/g.55353  ORF Transcript_20014/g.55353 Transcript_20014/m.55353 type:complete len:233 (-) Transcript_20014:1073-1771(-)
MGGCAKPPLPCSRGGGTYDPTGLAMGETWGLTMGGATRGGDAARLPGYARHTSKTSGLPVAWNTATARCNSAEKSASPWTGQPFTATTRSPIIQPNCCAWGSMKPATVVPPMVMPNRPRASNSRTTTLKNPSAPYRAPPPARSASSRPIFMRKAWARPSDLDNSSSRLPGLKSDAGTGDWRGPPSNKGALDAKAGSTGNDANMGGTSFVVSPQCRSMPSRGFHLAFLCAGVP